MHLLREMPVSRRWSRVPFRSWVPALTVAALALAGCHKKTLTPTQLSTSVATRADISVTVQATGVVEPVDTIQIKSKASGPIINLPVDIGTDAKAGALLAQIDPRDVQNQFNQTMADDVSSAASMQNAKLTKARNDSLLKRRVITAAGYDSATVNYATVVSNLMTARANLDIARQNLEDATIRAPLAGTVISRPVAMGTMITSSTGAGGGGTTLMTMADLSRVRMRVTVDEVEMRDVRVGEQATVAVDAFPNRTFRGTVEKIEPQAVVEQGVTFFPVLVSITNTDKALMPGMNGEVTIQAQTVKNVVAVPIDAIRTTKELGSIARLFGMNSDSLDSRLQQSLTLETAPTQNFVVVGLPDGSYELRRVQLGANNLENVQVVSGVNAGDKVVLVGTSGVTRPTVPPKLTIAADIRRNGSAPPAPSPYARQKDTTAKKPK
jgi:HlyD family secretion protein